MCTAQQGIESVQKIIYVPAKSVCSALNVFVKYLGNPAQTSQHPIPSICAQAGYKQTHLTLLILGFSASLTEIQTEQLVGLLGTQFNVQDIIFGAPGVYLLLRHDWNL